MGELRERPAGYVGPNLDPTGVRLRPHRLGDSVYALMANKPPRDNSGVIVGERGALVVDAGINGAMARRIQDAVARLAGKPGKPILYLVNTNYHGDHTFGNYAFPAATEIVGHRLTRAAMTDLDAEKQIRARNLHGDLGLIADVREWRVPNTVFDDRLDLDLGGRVVQLWHFGPGNTPGDTVVWEPATRTAWTGNMLGSERALPMLLEGGPVEYIDALAHFKATLPVRTIVSGHGPLGGARALDVWMRYLASLLADVERAYRLGLSAEAAVEVVPLDPAHLQPWWSPLRRLNALLRNMHRLNVLATYRALEQSGQRDQRQWASEHVIRDRPPAAA